MNGVLVTNVVLHAVKRTVSVLAILAIVGGGPWFAYERGKTKGYSMCAKERATYQAQTLTVVQADPKDIPLTILRIYKAGVVWFRK
jgi:hypothetical protein